MEFTLENTALVFAGFISGSVPWAVIFTKYRGTTDIRSVGDGNPGTTTSFIVAGWKIGLMTVVFESGKGGLPVLIADMLFNAPLSIVAIVGAACIVGHAYSPFLKFRGGKAVAVSAGVWTAITYGEAFLVACSLLALCHLAQRNNSWTVVLSMSIFVLFVILRFPFVELYALWIMNLILFIIKHWKGLGEGVQFRLSQRRPG